MIIIGLTGSIGMGKSYIASLCRRYHIPVFDADKKVHSILENSYDPTHIKIKENFQQAIVNDKLDKSLLGELVFHSPDHLKQLESLIHPRLFSDEEKFIKRCRYEKKQLLVIDIPLLFEKKRERICDIILVVSSPYWIQERRVMRRKGMTKERFLSIVKVQMPDWEKRKKADIVIKTGLSKIHTAYQFRMIIMSLLKKKNCYD